VAVGLRELTLHLVLRVACRSTACCVDGKTRSAPLSRCPAGGTGWHPATDRLVGAPRCSSVQLNFRGRRSESLQQRLGSATQTAWGNTGRLTAAQRRRGYVENESTCACQCVSFVRPSPTALLLWGGCPDKWEPRSNSHYAATLAAQT